MKGWKLNRGARGKLGTRGHTIPAADSDERLDVRVVKLLYGAPAEFTVLPAWGGNPELKEEKRETEKKKKWDNFHFFRRWHILRLNNNNDTNQ